MIVLGFFLDLRHPIGTKSRSQGDGAIIYVKIRRSLVGWNQKAFPNTVFGIRSTSFRINKYDVYIDMYTAGTRVRVIAV